jgi:prolyl-tRNA editing enzyme YbaK/EbsC (Cys-tRNA(Pro) deacylase)
MPPFGHVQPLPTLIDPRVLKRIIVWAGGGAENTLLRLDPQDILRAAGAQEVDLLEPDEMDRPIRQGVEK